LRPQTSIDENAVGIENNKAVAEQRDPRIRINVKKEINDYLQGNLSPKQW
jgi:hypothetical protein